MKAKAFVLLLAFLFLIPVAFSQQIEFATVRLSISENGNSAVQMLLLFDSTEVESLQLKALEEMQNISAYDSEGSLEVAQSGDALEIVPRARTKIYSLTVEFETPALTERKSSGDWQFYLEFVPLHTYSELSVELYLPENAMLQETQPLGIMYAADNRAVVEWRKQGIAPGSIALFEANYVFGGGIEDEDAADEFPLMFALAIMIVLAGAIVLIFLQATKEPKGRRDSGESREKVMQLLSDNERRIVEKLLQKDGISQRSLQVEIAMPKATLSRTLKALQQKDIVESKPVGNTNKIFLSESFKEQLH